MMNYTLYDQDSPLAQAASPLGERFDGWVITSELWEATGQGIVLPINPERLHMSMPIRGHEYEAAFGKALYSSFNKRKRTHFEAFNLQLTFNTGLVIPKWSNRAISPASDNMSKLESRNDSDSFTEAAINKAVLADLRAIASNGLFDPKGRRVPKSEDAQVVTRGSAYAASRQNDANTLYDRINPDTYDRTKGERKIPLIRLLGGMTKMYDPYIPPGVQNLYALTALLDGPKTWRPDLNYTETFSEAVPNRIKVYANSLAFPAMTFYGIAVEQGMNWTESADNPACFDVSMNMLVTATDPMLGRAQMANLLDSYKKNFQVGTLERFRSKNKLNSDDLR